MQSSRNSEKSSEQRCTGVESLRHRLCSRCTGVDARKIGSVGSEMTAGRSCEWPCSRCVVQIARVHRHCSGCKRDDDTKNRLCSACTVDCRRGNRPCSACMLDLHAGNRRCRSCMADGRRENRVCSGDLVQRMRGPVKCGNRFRVKRSRSASGRPTLILRKRTEPCLSSGGHPEVQPLAFEFDVFDRSSTVPAFAAKNAANLHPAYHGELQLVPAHESSLALLSESSDYRHDGIQLLQPLCQTGAALLTTAAF